MIHEKFKNKLVERFDADCNNILDSDDDDYSDSDDLFLYD